MNLGRNVGSIDKTVRLLAGAVLGAWAILGAGLGTTIGIVAFVIALVLLATGLMNFCPLFKVLGISSFRQN